MLPYLIAGAIGYGIAKLLEEDKAPKYTDGGSVLLAPNGKPSNLTPEQYKLVRTPAFKKWFGDWENDPANASKVVDDNGEPLVVYHGTNAEFNTFKLGYGSYSSFTENKTLALSYGDIINQFFLVIKNPYIINGNGEYIWKVIDDKASPEEFFGGSVPFSNDGIMFKDVIDFNGALGSKYVLDVSNVYMVRKNNQIKLADGTNTTFDASNPDIRFKDGGETDKEKIIKKTYSWYSSFQDRYYKDINSAYSDIERVVENNNRQFASIFGKDNPQDIINLFNFIETKKGIEIKPKIKKTQIKKVIEYNTDVDLVNKQKQVWEYAHGIEIGRHFSKLQKIDTNDKRIYGTEKPEENNIIAIMNKLKNGDELPPILLDYDYGILDGHHRFEASKRLKIKQIPVIIYEYPDIRFDGGGEVNKKLILDFVNQVEAYQSNHYGTFNRDNLVESYHKLPDSIKEKIKPITTKNLFRGADGISYKSAISFTKNQDYAKMFGAYAFPFKVVKENKGLIDTKRLSALLSKMRIANEIGDDEGEVIVIEPIFSKDIIENIEKFRFDNGGLIAPNGKPSNLTPEQYKLVRTKAFKQWFGDWENDPANASKVVDENGEPMVVYRGSKSKNPNYIPNKHELSKGIYFSTKKEVAELYTTSVWQNSVGRVFDCFLNIRNIDVYDTFKLKSNIYQSEFNYYNNLVIKSKKNNFDGIRWDNFIDVPDLRTLYPNEPIDYLATTFIVFEPNQIKLADGSNTTFDGNNPDIRYAGGGSVNVIDVKQYNVGGRNYRFVEIAEKNNNKIELYIQTDDGNYYGHLLYRRVPRYDAEFSSPMVNDLNQLYAYEPVSQIDLFNAVKNRKKPFASIGYWLSYYTEEEIQKEIESFIDECHKYDLEYAVEDLMDEDGRLDRKQFQVCQKGTFDELFDIDALLGDYFKNDFDSYDVKKIIEFKDTELSYFLTNEWDDNYALTGLILGIPPKFTMGLLNMGTTYGLGKDYKYDNKVIIMNK